MHTNSYAKAGLILGIIAIICGILFFIYSILTLLIQFGGIEGYLQSIEELIQDMEYPNSSNPYDFYDML